MLTPEGLRAIVERDRRDREYIARVLAPQEPSPRDAALEAELGPLPDVASVVGPTRAEQDRANLLALLRAVAAVDWTAYGRCLACDHAEGHGPACPAPALEALRIWDEDGYCRTCGGGPDETGATMPHRHTPTCALRSKP